MTQFKETIYNLLMQAQVPEGVANEIMTNIPDEVSKLQEAKEIAMNTLESSSLIDAEEYKKRLDDYLGTNNQGIQCIFNQFP